MVREAREEDYGALARLCGQLGYPSTPEEIANRLARLKEGREAVTLVSVEYDEVVGWIQLQVVCSVTNDAFAEIYGLVVDETHRGRGLGRQLIQAGAFWARERGFSKIRLRTNLLRKDAHRFYERIGFTTVKEQRIYELQIHDPTRGGN